MQSCTSTLRFPAQSSGQEGVGRSEEAFFWGTALCWGNPPMAKAVEQQSESSPLIQIRFGGVLSRESCLSLCVVLVPCPLHFSLQWEPECFAALLQRQQATEHISDCAEMHLCPFCSCCPIGHEEKCLSHQVHRFGTSGGWGLAVPISV